MAKATARRRPRKAKAGSRGLTPLECRLESLSGDGKEAKSRVEGEGGMVVGCYSDPLGKNPLILLSTLSGVPCAAETGAAK